MLMAPVVAGSRLAAWQDNPVVVRPHAATATKRFSSPTSAYSFDYPADWDAHEAGERVNVGAADGLVPTGRGFRTIYGAILAIVDDPDAGKPDRTVESSAKAVIDGILKRNAHQSLSVPVRADRPLAGAPAANAVMQGTSPVTGRGERAEVVCRAFGTAQVFYVILVSPIEAYSELEQPLQRLRDSIRLSDGK